MRFIRPSLARAQVRAAKEASQVDQERLVAAQRYEETLRAIRETISAVKVPNGTTKRVARLVNEALPG